MSNDDLSIRLRRLTADIEMLEAGITGLRQRAAEFVSTARELDQRAEDLEKRITRLRAKAEGVTP